MKRVVILTGHFPIQHRRGSILWLSDEFQKDGWHVTHVTVGYSWISRLKGDRRLKSLPERPRSGITDISPRLRAVFGYTPLHPFSTRSDTLDALLRPFHRSFGFYWAQRLREHLQTADLVLIESGPPILLAPFARRFAPNAALVYRINDDTRLLGRPHWVTSAEERYAPLFDRISTASPYLARRFKDHPTLAMDPMGLAKDRLTRDHPDPYGPARATKEAVCAGTTQFDLDAVRRIAVARPDWRLHILGHLRKAPPADTPKNILFHGEQSFDTTLSYIAHADIGLAPYRDAPGVEYQTAHSNRMLLYRHFGLPILGPNRLCDKDVPSILGMTGAQLEPALVQAEQMVRRPEVLPDWTELYRRIANTQLLAQRKRATEIALRGPAPSKAMT